MALNPRLRARFEREREQERRLTREQKEELEKLLSHGSVLFDEPTANHSAARAGGPVEAFVDVKDMDDLKLVFEWCATHNVEYRFWGDGAFTLVRDGGLAGIVIKLGDAFKGISVDRSTDDDVFLNVGAGATLTELVSFCETEGVSGAEGFVTAPGTVAGLLCAAVVPEGFALEGTVEEVTVLNREMKELTLRGNGLRFEEGRIKIPRTAAVTRLLLKLKRSNTADVASVVEEHISGISTSADLAGFAHSFKSPCKTKAADFIDDAGLRGVRVGGARISSDDALTILNEGEAKARDITVLISLIKDSVKQSSDVALLSTIDVVGER